MLVGNCIGVGLTRSTVNPMLLSLFTVNNVCKVFSPLCREPDTAGTPTEPAVYGVGGKNVNLIGVQPHYYRER